MLEELLKQFHNIINKYNFEFDKLPKAIWGVGNVANLNYTAGVFTAIKPEIFIDNGKANKTFIGKDIISFNDFLKLKKNKDYLVLTSILTQNILSNIFSQLKESNTKAFTVDHYIFTHQKKEVLETLDLLNDDLSKITYISMLIRRMGYSPTISFEYYTKPTRDSYFLLPQFHSRNSSQVFVDLGGYVGDTIESFLEHNDGIFKKIYSFEPNARNFKAMGYRVNRLINEWASEKDKFILENLGIGEFSQTAYIDAAINDGSALGAIISNNKQQDKEEIKITSIDDYFKDIKINFLKADIESYEWPMILGAQKTIKRDLPLIAICIYHNPLDMFRLIRFLHNLDSNYKFAIRQHYDDIAETILYAFQ